MVRRRLGVRRVGHTGTLDPFATGLLVLLVGRATRLSQYLVGLRKVYEGTIELGVSTDTHDLTGHVIAEDNGWQSLGRERIDSDMARFLGCHLQRPPKYSAKKVGGQRAYRLARRGEEVDLPPREIEVFDFSLTGLVGAELQFSCDVSSGTYVRALARDLGKTLGCGASLKSLRRTSVGNFDVDRAQALSDIEKSSALIGPPVEAVSFLPRVSVESEDVRSKIVHGQPIPAVDEDAGVVALVVGEQLIAIAERRDDMFKPKVVLEG